MKDFPVYLPGGMYLKALSIDPDFSVLSDIMQRAVVLLVCSKAEGLRVNGVSVIDLFRQATSSGAKDLLLALGGVADYLKDMLNAGDGLADMPENLVSSLEFGVEVESETLAKITLNITLANNTQESTVVYSYE